MCKTNWCFPGNSRYLWEEYNLITMYIDFVERFWNNIVKNAPDECWGWRAYKDPNGYGQMSVFGKLQRAHRISYSLHFGAITKGMFVCHRCDNPECTNPDHLFLGTNKDNMKDAYKKGRLPTVFTKEDGSWKRSKNHIKHAQKLETKKNTPS